MSEAAMAARDAAGGLATLDELGILQGTDKASTRHDYLRAYDDALSSRRLTAKVLLEIGVKKGASVRMWRDYLPNARIVGLDLNPACAAQAGDRIEIHIGSQTDLEFLDRVVAPLAVDIMVDDGSHRWEHQIASFRHLWPKLRPGGAYIVEDLHTSLATEASRYGTSGMETGVGFFSRLARAVGASGPEAGVEPDPFIEAHYKGVQEVRLGRRYCIVLKRTRRVVR